MRRSAFIAAVIFSLSPVLGGEERAASRATTRPAATVLYLTNLPTSRVGTDSNTDSLQLRFYSESRQPAGARHHRHDDDAIEPRRSAGYLRHQFLPREYWFGLISIRLIYFYEPIVLPGLCISGVDCKF